MIMYWLGKMKTNINTALFFRIKSAWTLKYLCTVAGFLSCTPTRENLTRKKSTASISGKKMVNTVSFRTLLKKLCLTSDGVNSTTSTKKLFPRRSFSKWTRTSTFTLMPPGGIILLSWWTGRRTNSMCC